MTDLIILHNPRCSKSRQTLALLEEKGKTPKVREYLNDPLKTDEIKGLLKKLGLAPKDIIRPKEQKDLGLARDQDDSGLIQQIADNPGIMQRPIVIAGNKAAIGRPPENVLDIL